MNRKRHVAGGLGWIAGMSAAVLLAAAAPAVALLAPTEASMGDAQRIVYLHVPVAWLGLLGLLLMAFSGAMYLRRRNLWWDQCSQAAAELGWLYCGLTLVTGSLWAHSAWGTWWTWDPRLTSAFVLWMIYSGCLVLRAQLDASHGRARLSAVLAILGALDIPLVVVAAHWFRGIHPPAAAMDPAMHVVLLWSTASFTALFFLLLGCRWRQLHRQALAEPREEQIDQPGLPENGYSV
jgi:heme exporter protein C